MKKFLLLLLIITGLSYGKIGQGLSFDGGDDYVSIANETNFDFERTNSFSISAWVNPSVLRDQKVISKLNALSNYEGWEIQMLSAAGTFRLWFISVCCANALGLTSNTAIPINQWSHITMTYNGSSAASGVAFYINGIKDTLTINTDALTTSILNNVAPTIGSRTDQTDYWQGLIDDVRVYNRALTAAEVRQVYYGIPTTQYGLVGHWQLLGTSNNFAPDISGKKNHGTLVNGPTRGALSRTLRFRR